METTGDIPDMLRAIYKEMGELERRIKWTDQGIVDLTRLRNEWSGELEALRLKADTLRRTLFKSHN